MLIFENMDMLLGINITNAIHWIMLQYFLKIKNKVYSVLIRLKSLYVFILYYKNSCEKYLFWDIENPKQIHNFVTLFF